jgi:GntR family transcriptional regulator of arabinose operon
MTAGDRFFSEMEVARIHGVNRQTVRQAISHMVHEGILTRRQGSGTFVRNPGENAPARKQTIGVISTYFNDYIFPSILTGIERVLTKNNISMNLMITSNTMSEEAHALTTFLSQDISGLIVEPSQSALPNPNTALYGEIEARDIPLVFFNAKYAFSSQPLIAMDDVAAARIATDHLISLGHEKIVGVFVYNNIQGHKRYQGFMNSMDRHKIPLPERRVLWYSTQEQQDLFSDSSERLLSSLEGNTAVVCFNDELAVALLSFVRERGIDVPGKLSVCGIDDATIARICAPPLTTVRHPKQQLGETAAKMLLAKMAGPSCKQEDKLFVPKLVKRESTTGI